MKRREIILKDIKSAQKEIASSALIYGSKSGRTMKLINDLVNKFKVRYLSCYIVSKDKGGKTSGVDRKVYKTHELRDLAKRLRDLKKFSPNR